MTVVVGVDSSGGSERALRFAVEEARLRGSPLKAIHVWQLPFLPASQDPFLAGPLYEAPVIDPREMRDLAERRLAELVSSVDTDGVEIERVLLEGDAAEALVQAGAGAEMLVVGSRGHGGISGLLLGSVSHAVAQHASCPVVIVRGPEDGD